VSIPPLPWSASLRLFLSLQKAPQPLIDFIGDRFTGSRPIVTELPDRLDYLRDRVFDAIKLLFEPVSHHPS
jgi:hypothetical protein